MRNSEVTLAIFSEDAVITNGDSYAVKNPLTRLYGELTNYFDNVVLSAPTKEVNDVSQGYKEPRIQYSPRPHYGSVVEFFTNFAHLLYNSYPKIKQEVVRSDVIMIRVPSPISPLVYALAKAHGKPHFMYVAGNISEVTKDGGKYENPITSAVARSVAQGFSLSFKIMSYRSLVFAIGSELREDYSRVSRKCVNLIPSIISESDITTSRSSELNTPTKLLYIGRLVPVKGIEHLLKAVQTLRRNGSEVVLDIVGDGPQMSDLKEIGRNLGIDDHVTFHGRVPFGPELFKFYSESDVFVLPSNSEGIPKTLIEAMAHQTPIVATRVGGIPDLLRRSQGGILVDTKSPSQIAEAIMRLSDDAEIREDMCDNQLEFIKEHTIESQAERIWTECKNYVL